MFTRRRLSQQRIQEMPVIAYPDVAAIDRGAVIAYIEGCQTQAGGFFSSRLPPTDARDIYHAVAALALLGTAPARSGSLRAWLEQTCANDIAAHPRGFFYLTMIAQILGDYPAPLHKWADRIFAFENGMGGFGTWRNTPGAVSELQNTYFAVTALHALGLIRDERRIIRFVLHFRNCDGGFGSYGHSSLLSTYHAASIFDCLGLEIPAMTETVAWLHEREQAWPVSHVEELYWLAAGLRLLNSPFLKRDQAVSFVMACQYPNGGFGRTPNGRPTLEYTHYALEILRSAGSI